ncbi:MAG: deoxyribose-phosphate aldolase [Treponema bryantii]|nr:deoxyribose-phosphate aldolase [Treponema bryantii]
MTKKEIASYIDHTALSADCGVKQIGILCSEALKYGFASVCVNPVNVAFASSELAGSDVKVCTVIGFPLGAATSAAKAFETEDAIFNGADEIDMVINIGAAKDGRYSIVSSDIATVVETARNAGEKVNKKIIVKVILETCLLDEQTIKSCCLCAKKAGADFVKTSTGFATPKGYDGRLLPNGASESHVKLMREVVGPDMGVKASGGIRSAAMAALMLKAGANRIGTSSGVNIVEAWNESTEI